MKALSEELENPMNVHRSADILTAFELGRIPRTSCVSVAGCVLRRWRKLEGSDPKRYELVQKIQTLQKRLIAKTEAVVEKDLQLQEKEKLYVELKNLLVYRSPPPPHHRFATTARRRYSLAFAVVGGAWWRACVLGASDTGTAAGSGGSGAAECVPAQFEGEDAADEEHGR